MPINTQSGNNVSFSYVSSINSIPTYLNIPFIVLSGAGFVSGTTAIGLKVVVATGSTIIVTTTFNISQNYATGINIPLSASAVVSNAPAITFTTVMGVQTPTPTAQDDPHLISGDTITCTISSTSNISNVLLSVYNGLQTALQGTLYGTLYLIYPTISKALFITSPITYSALKSRAFTPVESNSLTASPAATISYSSSATGVAQVQGAAGTPLAVMSPGTAVISAAMTATPLYKSMSFVSPTISIKNYETPSDKIVPFFNVAWNFLSTMNDPDISAYKMRITFTQNVKLSELNFANIISQQLSGTSGGLTGGYRSSANNTIFTLSINRAYPSVGLTIPVGTIAITTTNNPVGEYNALANTANNLNGTNDGTLLSIPFSSSDFSYASYVSNFAINGLTSDNLTFNVGDRITIEMNTSQNSSSFALTPLTGQGSISTTAVPMGELAGALIATPIATAPAQSLIEVTPYFTPAFVGNSISNVVGASMTINGKTIATAFTYSGINFGYVNAAVQTSIRFDIAINTIVVLQVWLNYNEIDASLKSVRIPFSYADFIKNRNPNITNIYFYMPQNPIIDDTNVFTISAYFPAAMKVQFATSGSGTTSPAGGVYGIQLNVPTFSSIPVPITPVMCNNSTTTNVQLPFIPSNSPGEFLGGTSTLGVVSKNATGLNLALTSITIGVSTVTVKAVQASTSIYSTGIVSYPTFDVVDCTGYALASCSSSLPFNTTGYVSTAPSPYFYATAWTNATLCGFSFQYFGGFNLNSGSTITMSVQVYNTRGKSLTTTITFTASTAINSINNGTMTYVPFSMPGQGGVYGLSKLPTNISNFNITGQVNPPVAPGDTISINLNGSGSSIVALNYTGPSNTSVLCGSLVSNYIWSGVPSSSWIYSNTSSGNLYPINSNNGAMGLFNTASIINWSTVSLANQTAGTSFSNGIVFTFLSMNVASATKGTSITFNLTSTAVGPNFNFTTSTSVTVICFADITNITMWIPFNMPLPNQVYSKEYAMAGNMNYYVQSVESYTASNTAGTTYSNTFMAFPVYTSGYVPTIYGTVSVNYVPNTPAGSLTMYRSVENNIFPAITLQGVGY